MESDPSGSNGWRFAQCFGDKGEVEDITEGRYHLWVHIRYSSLAFGARLSSIHWYNPCSTADIISTVEFDSTGNYLATGDKGGRVVLFERNESVRVLVVSPPQWADCGCDPLSFVPRSITEKRLRIQVLHRVPIAWTRVRLSKVAGDRREDKQD